MILEILAGVVIADALLSPPSKCKRCIYWDDVEKECPRRRCRLDEIDDEINERARELKRVFRNRIMY